MSHNKLNLCKGIQMKKKVILILLVFVLLGSVSTLVLYNIGDYFLISAFDLVVSEEPEPANPETADHTPAQTQTAPAETDAEMPREGTAPAGQEAEGAAQPGHSGEAESGKVDNAPQNTNSVPDGKGEGEEKEILEHSSKEIADMADGVSATDKISASLLVLSKLSSADIQYLYDLAEGGLTPEEKAAAKKLCYARFNSEEIAQIYELYKKYAE